MHSEGKYVYTVETIFFDRFVISESLPHVLLVVFLALSRSMSNKQEHYTNFEQVKLTPEHGGWYLQRQNEELCENSLVTLLMLFLHISNHAIIYQLMFCWDVYSVTSKSTRTFCYRRWQIAQYFQSSFEKKVGLTVFLLYKCVSAEKPGTFISSFLIRSAFEPPEMLSTNLNRSVCNV